MLHGRSRLQPIIVREDHDRHGPPRITNQGNKFGVNPFSGNCGGSGTKKYVSHPRAPSPRETCVEMSTYEAGGRNVLLTEYLDGGPLHIHPDPLPSIFAYDYALPRHPPRRATIFDQRCFGCLHSFDFSPPQRSLDAVHRVRCLLEDQCFTMFFSSPRRERRRRLVEKPWAVILPNGPIDQTHANLSSDRRLDGW